MVNWWRHHRLSPWDHGAFIYQRIHRDVHAEVDVARVVSRVEVQADYVYSAGVQYTIRNIPPHLDRVLRQRAQERGQSLNETTIDALLDGVGLTDRPVVRRDLSDIAGAWVEDPEIDAALKDQRRIDPDLWDSNS